MSTLAIKPGRNVWLLGRTDRDAPDAADVEQTAAAWLSRVFHETLELQIGQKLPEGGTRFYTGAARPLDVHAVRPESAMDRPALPTGTDAWRFELDQPDDLALNAEKPWYVVADFDWRGPTLIVADWPRRVVNQWGVPTDDDQQLDWLLLSAHALGSATRPDSSASKDILPGLGSGFSGIALLLAVLYFARR